MHGLAEIRKLNDTPQTKREVDYRVQRDRLQQVLRKVLAARDSELTMGAAVVDANEVLVEIYGA